LRSEAANAQLDDREIRLSGLTGAYASADLEDAIFKNAGRDFFCSTVLAIKAMYVLIYFSNSDKNIVPEHEIGSPQVE
jgi:hypothetical protein